MEIKDIITMGASVRVRNAIKKYEECIEEYEISYLKMEKKREEVNEVLKKLIKEKKKAIVSLNKIKKLSKNIKGKDRKVNEKLFDATEIKKFDEINKTISYGNVALNTAKGVSSGIGTAFAAWSLVSTFGTASTGTVISTLSGAAATNATLAWFGGGSLAVGGGGMAAGSVVLGGIVVIPAIALTGMFNHLKARKEIKPIKEATFEIEKMILDIKGNLIVMDNIEKRSFEILDSLKKVKKTFKNEYKIVYRKIYPIPMLSILFKIIRKNIFKKDYFSKKDVREISYILEIATKFAKIIEIRPIEDKGDI